MNKDGKTTADSVEKNDFTQDNNQTIANHIKAKYLYLVSQTSLSLDEKTENAKNSSNIQYRNDKIALIAADLALQYLQRRNMSLTLDSALSESRNLLVRHFEDRWLAREVQVRGRQDVLHGLVLSKKNNTFDIGFGSNFMKKKREEEEKKYRSNTFRSKSQPAGNNLVASLKEFDESDKQDKQLKIEKQNNDSDIQSHSNRSKSSKSSKAARKSNQEQKLDQAIADEVESQNNSSKIDRSESQPCFSHITNTIKRFSKRDAEIDIEQDNISNNQSQSQKTSNGSGSNNIGNTTNSNILPSPLKTTYSGREDESENNSNDFGIDEEIKTHTYQYSTIYSDEEATHETRFEYETIEQLTESNDYNSKTYEYSQNDDISPQNLNNSNINAIKIDNSSISASPNINNYTSASYAYYTYTTNNENEYSNNQQDQQINIKNSIPPKRRQQQEDLQLQFPFVQSRDANVLSDEDNNLQQEQNSQPQHKQHHDYYYHKHSKKNTKLGFSAPVEFDNPCDLVEIEEDGNHQIEAIEKVVENHENSNTIEEEEEFISEEEKLNEEKPHFFIFHAVDIEPDYELQKIFRSKIKQNKGKFTSSVLEEINESLHNSQREKTKEASNVKSTNRRNKNTEIVEREIGLDSSPEVQKERKFKYGKRNEDEGNVLYVNNKNKNSNHNQSHKHQHHGSIKRGSQIIDSIDNSKLSQISNIENKIRKNPSNLSSGVSSLIIIPSSSSAASIYYSTAEQKKRVKPNRKKDQISIEKNRKTKFSNKLVSSKNDKSKKINRPSPPLKEGKNSSASLGSFFCDINISDYSNTGLSLDKICEAISEDELLEMSDAPSVSFD